jgi:hypothetical protein
MAAYSRHKVISNHQAKYLTFSKYSVGHRQRLHIDILETQENLSLTTA